MRIDEEAEATGPHQAAALLALYDTALPEVFGYLVARARGVDIFHAGSGNIGATNVGRVLGPRWGVLVFLLDFAKGALPVAVPLILDKGQALATACALAAFLGARLTPGSAWVARRAGLGPALDRADLVLTGEGRFDAGSLAGKGTGRVIREARRRGLPVAVVCVRAEGPAPAGVLVVDAGETPGRLSLEDLGRLARRAFGRLANGLP